VVGGPTTRTQWTTEGVGLGTIEDSIGMTVSVSVVMISRNEEAAVGPVISAIRAAVPRAEVVLVDSSTDRTAEVAEAVGARVIRQLPPRGYGPAMAAALRAAQNDVVVTLDCDGTYPAEAIPELVELVEAGWDLVNASRLWTRPDAMPYANYLANALFAKVTWLLHGLPVTDVHSGMRAYRRAKLGELDFDPNGPALPVELLVLAARQGWRIAEVPIRYLERTGTTTLNRFDSTVWTFRRLLRLLRVGERVPSERFGRCELGTISR
jgi:glycosyltransferase involved in cell wall biosynthesis